MRVTGFENSHSHYTTSSKSIMSGSQDDKTQGKKFKLNRSKPKKETVQEKVEVETPLRGFSLIRLNLSAVYSI